MSIHSLKPLSTASSPTVNGNPISASMGGYVPTGNPDEGICLQTLLDGLTCDVTVGDSLGADLVVGSLAVYFEDDGVIPAAAVINSVQLKVHHTGNAQFVVAGSVIVYISPPAGGASFISIDPAPAISATAVMIVNPVTLVTWQREDLFNDNDSGLLGNGFFGPVFIYNGVGFSDLVDEFELIVDYVGVTVDSASPSQGGTPGGASVAINGTGFADAGTLDNVFFDGVAATDLFVLNDNVIICRSPAHVKGFVNIVVEFDGDQTSSTSPIFEYIQFQFFTPEVENLSPVRIGDKIIINSTLPFMGGATQIQLNYPDNLITLVLDPKNPYLIINGVIYYWLNFVFVQTQYQLQFYLPFGFRRFSGLVTVTLIGNGIQFSGSVLAGVLEVLFADVSGIYSLTEGQTNDVLYFRDGYTTITKLLFLSLEEEVENDNYFSIKEERLRMLAQNDFDYDEEEFNNFMIIGVLQIPVVTIDTEIPSPFIMTAFLP